MSTRRPKLPETPENPDHDPVWNLLQAAPRRKAGPAFARNTLRRARQEKTEKPASPWRKIFSPKPLAAAALAACAAVALIMANLNEQPSQNEFAQNPDPVATENANSDELADLQDELSGELLVTAAENPELFSDREVLAFLD